MSRGRHSDADLAADFLGMIAMLTLVLLAALVFIAGALLIELWKVYSTRGLRPGRTRRVLWSSLAGLLGVWVVCAILLSSPATATLGVYAAPWSLLLFTTVVVICEMYERGREPPLATSLEQVLEPWTMEKPARPSL